MQGDKSASDAPKRCKAEVLALAPSTVTWKPTEVPSAEITSMSATTGQVRHVMHPEAQAGVQGRRARRGAGQRCMPEVLAEVQSGGAEQRCRPKVHARDEGRGA